MDDGSPMAASGFLPMALSQGAGAEVQRPLARVAIGGPPAPDARRPTERPSGLAALAPSAISSHCCCLPPPDFNGAASCVFSLRRDGDPSGPDSDCC